MRLLTGMKRLKFPIPAGPSRNFATNELPVNSFFFFLKTRECKLFIAFYEQRRSPSLKIDDPESQWRPKSRIWWVLFWKKDVVLWPRLTVRVPYWGQNVEIKNSWKAIIKNKRATFLTIRIKVEVKASIIFCVQLFLSFARAHMHTYCTYTQKYICREV